MSTNRRVVVVPYDPDWTQRAITEAARLSAILEPVLLSWDHVGSTSVPGLMAKPIVDIMPIVRSVAGVDELRPELEAAGYRWYGEYGLPGRRYLNRDDPATGERVANIHIYEADNPEVARHLAFRNFLRDNPATAAEYAVLKVHCAALCPEDVNAYNDCKNDWIKALEPIALRAREARLVGQ